jgi:hypothetical protein
MGVTERQVVIYLQKNHPAILKIIGGTEAPK